MKPKLIIKKFNGFSPKTPSINLIHNVPPIRYLLDLGPKGRYIVSSELPSIRRRNVVPNFLLEPVSINPIRVIIRDIIGDSDVRNLIEWFDSVGNNKINATLQRIDPLGVILDQWFLFGCRPTYFSSEPLEPFEMVLQMDNFTLQF